ncbi:MAG: DUF192 domain-containing protein [Patescibacteria group bacterium]
MRTRLLIAALALVIVVLAALLIYTRAHAPAESVVADTVVSKAEALPGEIEVVDTQEKRMLGLSGRKDIADDYGMLFVFDAAGKHGFWMKDMLFTIDIVWLSDDGTIVHVEHSVPPSSYPSVLVTPVPASFALETNAGYAKEHGWDTGTKLDISKYQSN